jgi:Flp pilus assembly protein TadG
MPSRPGAAMVEFALVLPILMFALVAAVDFARVFYHDQTIINCARSGAIWASDPASALRNTYPGTDGYKDAALADATSLNPPLTAADITCVPATPVEGSDVAVTVTYTFPTLTSYLGFSEVVLTKTVTMRVAQTSPD